MAAVRLGLIGHGDAQRLIRDLRPTIVAAIDIAWALDWLGNAARDQGDLARAASLHEEALALCRAIGLELPARVKAVDTAVVTRPAALAAPHLILMDCPQATYFRPESGILTMVGVPCQEWDPDPDTLGTGLPPAAAPEAARLLVHRIPAMEGATLARGYRAFDLYSLDRHAILDRVDGLDGLYLATAFSGTGFKIAPAVGVGMAELILDGQGKTVDLQAFGLRRFREGRPLEGPHPYAPRPRAVGWHHAAGIYS